MRRVRLGVFRIHKVLETQGIYIAGGAANHRQIGRITKQEPALKISDGDARGGVLEKSAEPFLAFAQRLLAAIAFQRGLFQRL